MAALTREIGAGPIARLLNPFVDWVARAKTTVHHKMLAGFMVIALLLLSLGVLSIAVLGRVNTQVEKLTSLHEQTDMAREMIYQVTAQSHFRAMQLLDDDPENWEGKIADAKAVFATDLVLLRELATDVRPDFWAGIEVDSELYDIAGEGVQEAFETEGATPALALHIDNEHEISHDIEDALNEFIDQRLLDVRAETDRFSSDRRFLTWAVASFSMTSLLAALGLGAVLSWALIRPVKRVDQALERIADGDFDQKVEVPNRDEFGSLTTNLNRTTNQLAKLYGDLNDLNQNLQETVEEKVQELERAGRLKRYLSPQVATSILEGEAELQLGSRRKLLTIFFSDIRNFTEMSERMEPEELVEELNTYLSAMTDIVFAHGGTLDKYIGDAVMVFFGDPIRQDDHAQRAIAMALEMREKVVEFHERWQERYDESFEIGMGLSTGWVTVGDIGSDVHTDYTVMGNHVNLASRLADTAEADQILISERTLRAVEDSVEAHQVDEIKLKGVSRPIKIYEIDAMTPLPVGAKGSV